MVANGETYVVSAYLSPPRSRAFTSRRHDQSVALWLAKSESIELVRYWEIERLSGYKHHALPLHKSESAARDLLARLLAAEGVTMDQVSEIWGTPGLELTTPLPDFDRKGLPVHSIGHLFSGLCLDTKKFRDGTIVALAMDAGPDHTLEQEALGDNWYAGAISRKGRVELLPVESPGVLWQAAGRLLGFEPGTLMALAHASTFAVPYDIDPVLAERYMGGNALILRCSDMVSSMIATARQHIEETADKLASSFSDEELVGSAVGKLVQAVSIHIARRNVEALLDLGGIDPTIAYLSLSGGYALNCPTNSRLLDLYGFRGLLTPPCANDSGQALGIGLFSFFAQRQLESKDVVTTLPYSGESRVDLASSLTRWGNRILDVRDYDEETWVEDITRHPVAWVDGAAEVGPRALGHRSLLGDPRSAATKEILNVVKQRQWWRPVAPIVLEGYVNEWFVGGRPSALMLETFLVAPEYQPQDPAIMHLDGSPPNQTLTKASDAFLTDALSAFHAATGVPMICNTSLNDRGEPIANSADDAIAFCLRKGIEVAYIDRRRVLLDVGAGAAGVEVLERPLASLYRDQERRPAAIFGPDVDPEILYLLYFWPRLHGLAQTDGGMARLRRIAKVVAIRDPGFRRRATVYLDYYKAMLSGTVPHSEIDG